MGWHDATLRYRKMDFELLNEKIKAVVCEVITKQIESLLLCGQRVEFYKVCGADHGIFFWTDEVLDTVLQFLRANLNESE